MYEKIMSTEVIKEHYKPWLSIYGDRVSVKTKMNTGGHRKCRCWDENNPRDLLENWLSNLYDVKVSIPQLWVMGSDFGLTMECIDLMIRPDDAESPF